jgi:orotidine-5'-phosphate decarboxylase
MRLATLAQQCGLNGVVCSGQEVGQLKSTFGAGFKLVTPGIRPAGGDAGDQVRILTPEKAISLGADYLVIGRPITQAAEPLAALQKINQSIATLDLGRK